MSASEKDLNSISPSHTGSNVAGNASGSGGPGGNIDPASAYFGHLHYPHLVNNNSGTSPNKPPSQTQKPASSQKSTVNSPPASSSKPKQTPRPANHPTTVKPSATTNAPVQPLKNAPAPTPPGSAAVMAAVMAQAQAAAGQAIAAQQANKQQTQPQPQPQQQPQQPQQPLQPQQPPTPSQHPSAQHPPPIPAHHHPQAYPYPYPYYLPPGQPGAPPYLYPGAPGAPAFLPAGTPGQGGAPPPGYPYMYPMYPAPIPVPQPSPAPVAKEKKTQRTYQACQKCRQWKSKCNGLKPCNHCQKRGVPCEYAERRNMTGPNETNNGEPSGSQEESPQPARDDVKPADATTDGVDPSALNNSPQTSPPVSNPPPPPQASHPPAQAPTQVSPPIAGSPPHPTQVAQPPPPMAIYPPPPGYAYPPQLYPGMPFPAPGPDPNAPYAHFVGMQYAQPYGPYMWAAPPPPPGHEPPPAAHIGDQEEGERDADGKLKIKRTFQACQKCRQRKAKCNGARPSCQNCTSRGYACEYAKERSKPRGANGEDGDETMDGQGADAPTTMDPSQAMVSTAAPPVNPNQQTVPGAPPVPPTAPPNMYPPPPFPYDPNAYNPHVDPHQHGGQPMYPFPPYGYGHPPGFGSIAGPPLVHIGEEGAVPPYHAAVPPPTVLPGPPPSNSPTSGSSKRPRTVRLPGAPGAGKARIFQACERCRERKAKCDGVRPICTHCATRDLSCEWADKRRMRGPAKGITPRRSRPESDNYPPQDNPNVNMGMPPIPLGLNTAGLQQIEPHTSTNSTVRKRKRRQSHSSGSPSPSESSSSSESSPSESDDDDADRNSSMGMGTGAVSTGWA